jgi:hypothetical protein
MCSLCVRQLHVYVSYFFCQTGKNYIYILYSNKNVNIKFSAYDMVLELPSSDTLNVKMSSYSQVFNFTVKIE